MTARLPSLLLLLLLVGCAASPAADRASSATYSGVFEHPVTLAEGRYEGEPYVEGGAARPTLVLVEAPRLEQVVLLAENSGGSGTRVYMAWVPASGELPDAIEATLLGDRVKVLEMTQHGSAVRLHLIEHGPQDARCCPTQEVWREFTVEQGGLVTDGVALERFRGELIWGHENRSFTACGTGTAWWVADETGGELPQVVGELAGQPYAPLFVELLGVRGEAPQQGFGADFAGQLTARELLRAQAEGHGCSEDLTGVHWLARGNEPFWNLRVGAEGLELTRMGQDSIKAPADAVRRDVTGDERSWEADRIRVVMRRERCVDTMSGARFAYSARVEVDGASLDGCAIQGMR